MKLNPFNPVENPMDAILYCFGGDGGGGGGGDSGADDFGFSDGLTRGWAKIQEELDKCVMLCCLCHRKRHFLELDPVFNG